MIWYNVLADFLVAKREFLYLHAVVNFHALHKKINFHIIKFLKIPVP